MCRNKEHGGRRCKSYSDFSVERKDAINARRRQQYTLTKTPLISTNSLFAGEDSMRSGTGSNFYDLAESSQRWSDLLSQEEKVIMKDYTNHGFRTINRSLYDFDEYHRVYGTGEIHHHIPTIDEALKKYTSVDNENTILYRSFRPPTSPENARQWVEDHYKVGEEVEFNSYLSTSADPNVVANMLKDPPHPEYDRDGLDYSLKNVVFEIIGSGVPLASVSDFENEEREVLLPRGKKFVVQQVLKDVTYKYVDPRDGFEVERNTMVIQMVEVL